MKKIYIFEQSKKLKMEGQILSPIIGSAMGLLGGVFDSITSKRNTDKTIKANKELAEYQYQKDLEMWNRGNEYNSPLSQMQRLKDANLNPNLVYGSGAVVGNSSSTLPKYQAPSVQYNYKSPLGSGVLSNMVNMYQSVQMQQAQINNVEAQTNATNVKASLDAMRAPLIKKTGEKIGLDIQNLSNLIPYNLESKKLQNQKIVSEMSNLERSGKLIEQNTKNAQIEAEKKKAEIVFQMYRNQMAKIGITNSDNPILRLSVRALDNLGIDVIKGFQQFLGGGK